MILEIPEKLFERRAIERIWIVSESTSRPLAQHQFPFAAGSNPDGDDGRFYALNENREIGQNRRLIVEG